MNNDSTRRAAAKSLAELLGLPLTALDVQIKRAFRAEMKRLHPDLGIRTTSETDRLKALTAAYELFDQELAHSSDDEPDPGRDDWSEGRPPSKRAEPTPWFTAVTPGAQPQPGFWDKRPTRQERPGSR
jgi:hypothetical protein